jgi:hypothetical protein
MSSFEKMMALMLGSENGHSFIFSTELFTEEDLNKLSSLALYKKYEFRKIGPRWLIGNGFSYLIMQDLLGKGDALSDPLLKIQFERIVRYHENSGTPVIFDYAQGASAYFSPSQQMMAFVIPSRSSLNSYTHEMMHSRFEKFKQRLDSWLKAKKYSVPFQIDGPALDGLAAYFSMHGGLFNLLNELNSWRIGQSFHGQVSDKDILDKLTMLYGPQAGYEATDLLNKVWTPEKLLNLSVPYLIYGEIKKFNSMSNEEIIQMGLEGLADGDSIWTLNFLIMFSHRHFEKSPVAQDALFVLNKIASRSKEPQVLKKIELIKFGLGNSSFIKNIDEPDLADASLDEVLKYSMSMELCSRLNC